MKVGLGICARNEEVGIVATLASVVDSVCSVDFPLNWQLIVCANGCTDRTTALVKQWVMNNRHLPVSLESLETASLVEAQRVIATRLKNSGSDLLAFFDADILVDRECVSALIRLASDDSVKAAYAVSVPISGARQTAVEKALNQYDSDHTIFSERRHIHGRAFLIKEWEIPATNPPLLADDIYLSCDLLYRYGPQSIVVSPKAKVYFYQIRSVADFYSAYKRRNTELRKCLRLFPHFRSLPTEQLNRRLRWNTLVQESLSRGFHWIVLLMLRRYSQLRIFIEGFFTESCHIEWVPTKTSKKPL